MNVKKQGVWIILAQNSIIRFDPIGILKQKIIKIELIWVFENKLQFAMKSPNLEVHNDVRKSLISPVFKNNSRGKKNKASKFIFSLT